MNRNCHDDRLGLRDACEVDVDDVVTHGTPLDGSQKCRIGDFAPKIHQFGAVLDQFVDRI